MNSPLTIFLLIFICLGCSDKQGREKKTIEENEIVENEISIKDEELEKKSEELRSVFSKATKIFPADSASLKRFYFKTFRAETTDEMEKHINRINILLQDETVKEYNEVTIELKPLLQDIVQSNSVTRNQSIRFSYLYSIYDKYSGVALFSKILTEDDNYNLVWKSMEIMVANSKQDTCYISSLINLDNSTSTNIELAEKLGEFVIESIKNNPTGFLLMYSVRNEKEKIDLARHAMLWDDPVPDLVSTFELLTRNSVDNSVKKDAEELLRQIGKPL